jgi:dolichol-phosphate mannosyltransferase
MQGSDRISIIVPIFNEEANLAPLHEALVRALNGIPYAREIIFVDDGSTDGTPNVLARIAGHDLDVRVVTFSRNFGKEAAITAGIHHCTGDACILIDADLQHPPALIPEFIRKWKAGAEVVVGVRTRNPGDGLLRRIGSSLFNRIMNALSETPARPNATDFRLLDGIVIDEFRRLTEHGRLSRSLIDWLGFRREFVEFEASARRSGSSRFGTFALVRLALSSIVSHSLLPLKFAGYLGVVITLTSGLLGAFIFVENYVLDDPLQLNFSGPAILAVINLFLVGIMLCCLGLIALYIANIHSEVRNRPLYVMRRKRGQQ